MRSHSWLAITLGISAIVPITVTALTIAPPAWAQNVRNVDVPAAMNSARAQLQPIRQRLERAERAGRTEEYAAALTEMKTLLDDLAPLVESYSGDTAIQARIKREFDQWMDVYETARTAHAAEAGDFFMMMSQRWAKIAPDLKRDGEEKPAPFGDLVADPSIAGFGLPHTLATLEALDRYLLEVQTHPDYRKNKSNQNVVGDLANARRARADASERLAAAAEAAIAGAAGQKLDDAGRERVWTMLEKDIPTAMSGSHRIESVQARARALVRGSEGYQERLAALADALWPSIAGRYASVSDDPLRAARGDIVQIRDAIVLPANAYRVAGADLIVVSNGRPVICVLDPVVREHVGNILKETGRESLAGERAEVVGIVRGLSSVDLAQQPGSTPASTNPAGSEGESTPQTRPTLVATDGVAIDVIAIHAGPAAIGVDPPSAPEKSIP